MNQKSETCQHKHLTVLVELTFIDAWCTSYPRSTIGSSGAELSVGAPEQALAKTIAGREELQRIVDEFGQYCWEGVRYE